MAMDIEDLYKILDKTSLKKHRSYLTSLIKPAIEIIENTSNNKTLSHLGGLPSLPKAFNWPIHSFGEYRFLAQFDLADIQTKICGIPEKGLLSLFIADDPEQNYFWKDDSYILGYLFDTKDKLYSMNSPSEKIQPVRNINLSVTIDLPFYPNLLEENILNETEKDLLFYGIRQELNRYGHYLLGYPQYSSLAYNPIPGKNWISLLNLYSSDELEWNWHDGNRLMVFIEHTKLQAGDFSNLKADAG